MPQFVLLLFVLATVTVGCSNKKAEERVMSEIDYAQSVYFITVSKSYMFEHEEEPFDFITGRIKTSIYAGTIKVDKKPDTADVLADIVFFDKARNRLMEAKIFDSFMLFNGYYYRFDGQETLSHVINAKKDLRLPPRRMIH